MLWGIPVGFIIGLVSSWIKYWIISRRETNQFFEKLYAMDKRHKEDMLKHWEHVVKKTAPVIVNYFRERKSKKFVVIEKHISLFNKVFHGKDVSHTDWKNDDNHRKIVELFRADVGYSDKTASMDVFYQAYLSWKDFNEHQSREWN